MPEHRFVGYCRSSTPEQLLGLQIQRDVIIAHAARVNAVVVAWYEEMRPASPISAQVPQRQPELWRALAHCRREGATLLVARLDRLTRSAAFFSALLESGPPVVIAELPNAPPFVLQIYAAVAEEYLQRVSRRIKASKARARAEGRRLSPHSKHLARHHHALARTRNRPICTILEELRRGRPMAASDVARELNERGCGTRAGKRPWTEATVYEVWRQFHRQWRSTRFPGASRACAASRARAGERAEALRGRIMAYRADGALTAADICGRLNRDKVLTLTGRLWSVGTARVLLRRLA